MGTKIFDLVTLTFDLLVENFNLAASFDWSVLGLWHFTCVFLMTRPFHWYQKFDLVTLTLVIDLIVRNFNFGCNFWMLCTRILIFHELCSSDDKTFLCPNRFDLVTLVFDLHNETVTMPLSFNSISMTLIFHMSVSWDNSFHGYQQIWPSELNLLFDLHIENFKF
jgi:hypothetical protein